MSPPEKLSMPQMAAAIDNLWFKTLGKDGEQCGGLIEVTVGEAHVLEQVGKTLARLAPHRDAIARVVAAAEQKSSRR